jgi:hypothetical protein
MNEDLWGKSRSGSHAGRGFHYQDAVAAELALRGWRGELELRYIVPEGLEDISLQLETGWLHLQAKSRRSHRGDFTLTDLGSAWKHLAERLVADRSAHAGLVLERELPGLETGLDHVLSDVVSGGVRDAIGEAIQDILTLDDFLDRTHVVVFPAAQATAVSILEEGLGTNPATCVAHYSILGRELEHMADENGARESTDPAGMTVGDIARLLDEVTEAVDPTALNEAVGRGLCELVDFATPIHDDRFYQGIDVDVGHVVAGLPVERPSAVESLRVGLDERGVTLAIGPSGSGKSTLVWLTVYETRHLIRWYRVRHLTDEDVLPIVRLVRGLKPTGARIGLVVDDIGRDDRNGFDRLVEELTALPLCSVIGACREEDLFLVRTAYSAVQVRPSLEQELAERIWKELRTRDETSWSEWREPFEMSGGLLLEYGHLLTEGTRLEETLNTQVDRRVREGRRVEIEVLALVSTADAFGAEISVERVESALATSSMDFKKSMYRLIDEHLIYERDGMLGGLHELRSRYVMHAIHSVPPPMLTDSARRVIAMLGVQALQPFVTRLLLSGLVADEVVIDSLADRLALHQDPSGLAAALHALRLVGFRRLTAAWRTILDEEEVSPSDISVVAHFVLHGGDPSIFPSPIQRAVTRLRRQEAGDRRPELLGKIAPIISSTLGGCRDVRTAALTLAALAESGSEGSIEADSLAELANRSSLEDLKLLLEASYSVSPILAAAIVDAIGGAPLLLARLEMERPWVRDARISVSDDGQPTAEAKYAFVAESVQANPHDEVVELARYLAALVPEAQIAVCQAIDATGKAAGYGGVEIANKAIDRRNLPTPVEVAWNRARVRAAISAVAASNATEHQIAARDVVIQASRLVRRASDTWVRGHRPTKSLSDSTAALAISSRSLPPPPIAIEAAGPLDEGELPTTDSANFIGVMIANNLLPNLFGGQGVGPLVPQLLEQIEKLAEPDPWELLAEAPMKELEELREALTDLHAVVAESARKDRVTAVALRAAAKRGIAASGEVARQRSSTRMLKIAETVQSRLSGAGFQAVVALKQCPPDSYRWPCDDVLVLVEVDTIFEWQQNLEALVELCRPQLADRISFYMAPVQGGRMVSSFAVKVIENVFPTDDVRSWADLPLSGLEESLGDLVQSGLGGLAEASGILATARREGLHDVERKALRDARARSDKALASVEALLETSDDQLLVEVAATLRGLILMVEDEAEAAVQGKDAELGLAAMYLAGLNGEPNDVFITLAVLRMSCVEWDVNPIGAWHRVEQALDLAAE